MEDQTSKFVVGLGNPGSQYERTRHNVGFMVLQELVRRWQLAPARKAFNGQLFEARRSGQKVFLLAPMTFMNRSGSAVQEMAAFYKAGLQDMMVILDELALPLGKLRFRSGGSSGGHNGLADVLNRMGSTELPRLRIGIGPRPTMIEGADFVLMRLTPQEMAILQPSVELAADAVEDWIDHGLTFVMEKYNRMGSQAQENEG